MQTDINDKMRAILIDWLVEVHLKFKVSTFCIRSFSTVHREVFVHANILIAWRQ